MSVGSIENVDGRAILRARHIHKTYGTVQALRGVDLDLMGGRVHALLGANGAGKSTLVRILAGAEQPDSGELLVGDTSVAGSLSPATARRLGLRFIHQDVQLVPKLTGVQNVLLREPLVRKGRLVSWRRSADTIAEAAKRAGVDFDLNVPVERLSLSERWILAVARALIGDPRVVAMDEPTASLPAEESARVYDVVRELAAQGVAVLYITHRLAEVVDLAHSVTVLRDGQTSARFSRGDFDVQMLVAAIVGSAIEHDHVVESRAGTEPVLEVRGLRRWPRVKNVSLTVHAGEVLGIGGLVGAGRTEMARILFGADRPDDGTMSLGGSPYSPRTPLEAVKRGVALVPEDRRAEGLLMNGSLVANTALPAWRQFRITGVPFLRMSRASAAARDVATRFGVVTSSLNTPVRQLSGGNQQKVLLGRWLRLDIRVLILDEPTRGVDVGARRDIHAIARAFADEGRAVIMISSELEELEVCDRVVVLREGEVVGELKAPNITEQAILACCFAA